MNSVELQPTGQNGEINGAAEENVIYSREENVVVTTIREDHGPGDKKYLIKLTLFTVLGNGQSFILSKQKKITKNETVKRWLFIWLRHWSHQQRLAPDRKRLPLHNYSKRTDSHHHASMRWCIFPARWADQQNFRKTKSNYWLCHSLRSRFSYSSRC